MILLKKFDDFNNGKEFFSKNIQSGEMKLEEAKNDIKNIKLLYKSREAVIQLFNDYSSIASEAKYKVKHRDGLKILTPKQMLQRLPIALSQVNKLTNWNKTNYIFFVLGKRNN